MSNRTPAETRRRPPAPALVSLLLVSLAACSDDPAGLTPTAPPVVDEVVASEDLLPSCGVGFWKTHAEAETWLPTGYAPHQAVASVLDGAEPWHELSLLEALALGGGPGLDGARAILLRAAVAALLNAAHPGIAYDMTGVEVVGAVEAALASGKRKDMIQLAEVLELLSDGSCVLAPEEPDEPEEPGLPDLIVSAIAFGAGTEINLPRTATIKNDGAAPADVEGVVVQGYYSVDTQLDLGVDDPACGRVASTTSLILDPGETVDVTNNCSPPDAGYNYLLIVVDRADAIVESDETNNVGSIEVPAGD